MVLQVALIADDLTGALDSVAPFAERGFRTLVALTPEQIEGCLAAGAEVVAVSTGSRHSEPAAAAALAGRAASLLAPACPRLAFKKVDSRLKGNIESECGAALRAFRRSRMMVAPAVPALGRLVIEGNVIGAGVERPIPVRDAFGALAAACRIPDTPDDAALDEVARLCIAHADTTLAVGARGLAAALARQLSPANAKTARPFNAAEPALFVIGSRDPVTRIQVQHLRRSHPDLPLLQAPDGTLAPSSGVEAPRSALLLCTEGGGGLAQETVAARLARTAAEHIRLKRPAVVLASGGDVAAALLLALGVMLVEPAGELLAGVPWSTVTSAGGPPLTLITKSGGFGGPDTLSALYERIRGITHKSWHRCLPPAGA
jgi:uncharacterized protein YgbK (DUF1537 family)